jgi:NAD(P)-dependent dehydrogenase (short-subunit alcohol dehydrogenase family)
LDILVSAAGIYKSQPIAETSSEDLDQVWAINVRAPYRLVQAALEHLQRDGGAVIFISSVTGHVGFANESAYAATKAALDGLVRALAVELAPWGIRVNGVAPGFTETPMNEAFRRHDEHLVERAIRCIPAGRLAQPRDIASAVAFLASEAASYIQGAIIPVDGNYPTSSMQLGIL